MNQLYPTYIVTYEFEDGTKDQEAYFPGQAKLNKLEKYEDRNPNITWERNFLKPFFPEGDKEMYTKTVKLSKDV